MFMGQILAQRTRLAVVPRCATSQLAAATILPLFCYIVPKKREDSMPVDIRPVGVRPVDIRGMAPLLQVFDMPTAVHFYRDVLGFELVSTSQPGDDFGWCLLRFRGVELMLNTAYDSGQRPPAPDPARVAAHDDTCLYFGCEDLDSTYLYLRSQGVSAREPKVAPYGMKQMYLKDPDGYGVCFQWPATQQSYDAWVAAYGLEPKTIA
jgi:glyoxylase I family protein